MQCTEVTSHFHFSPCRPFFIVRDMLRHVCIFCHFYGEILNKKHLSWERRKKRIMCWIRQRAVYSDAILYFGVCFTTCEATRETHTTISPLEWVHKGIFTALCMLFRTKHRSHKWQSERRFHTPIPCLALSIFVLLMTTQFHNALCELTVVMGVHGKWFLTYSMNIDFIHDSIHDASCKKRYSSWSIKWLQMTGDAWNRDMEALSSLLFPFMQEHLPVHSPPKWPDRLKG